MISVNIGNTNNYASGKQNHQVQTSFLYHGNEFYLNPRHFRDIERKSI